ncbi:MAG: hypothetical protein R3E21_05145 [Caenibius sp.]
MPHETHGSDCAGSAGEELLARLCAEMRVSHGDVPETLSGSFYDHDDITISETGFLFRTRGGVGFHYRKGSGVVVQLPPNGGEAAQDECEVFLWGTVFGAVAWLNGFLPLHASAVAKDGRVVAFTAESGGGKSTLAAGLAQHGWAHVCDDTLVLAPSSGAMLALPDGKPLKLWADALEHVPAANADEMRALPGKFYAQPTRRERQARPLVDLVFLEWGDRFGIAPISGSEKLTLLPQAMYRAFVHIARKDARLHAHLMMQVASSVRFWRLTRPKSSDRFDETLRQVADILESAVIVDGLPFWSDRYK